MAYEIAPPNTGSALANMSPESVRQLWQKTVDMHDQNEDWWAKFEGPSRDAPIATRTDLSKGAGQKVTITNMAGFYGPGKQGDEHFEAATDFEKLLINAYSVEVDWLRNAYAVTERMEEVMGMRGELNGGAAAELGKWMGRQKSHRVFMTFREKGDAQNLVIAGGKSGVDELLSADVLNYDEVIGLGAIIKPNGGRPALMGRANGQPVKKYNIVSTVPGMFSMKHDDDYREALKEAGARGDANHLFKGGYPDIDGHVFHEYEAIDHDGFGPVGCPMAPKAFLGEAIAAGTAVFTVKGGGSAAAAALTNILYFQDFAGYAYKFLAGDVLAPENETRYFLIVNPSNAAVDPNKIGMYSYTVGNDGNTITIVNRLGPADSVAQVDSLGDVTWNTGVWANKHTQVHPIGATIIPCNAKGVPIGETLMLGASAMIRGYGKYKNKRSKEKADGGHVERRYITSVFGQALRRDAQSRARGYVRLKHAIQYPELNSLPIVV
ncbi:DUF4043 family protein [Cerasicoccus frondis]|uniref:DUF4043 family protein n=1 Tax=Cerasicoccus frondis TaxID=490090 RepID=UPI002852B081|nr:DUF4043 family protein [Cerasicoccus frondis]